MADNDPFAEPDDDADRTVIKPNPGGRLTQPAAAPAPGPAPAQAPQVNYGVPAGDDRRTPPQQESVVENSMTGMNRLNASATTLFALVSRIRNRAQHMDPEKLRRSVVSEVRGFENRALQAGIDAQDVKIARYAMCATLDDVVLNTPWGGQSIWTQQSMVGTFHRETVGGDRFYDLLARLEKEPGKNIDLLEFLYVCLSLGFEGRLRVEQGGADKHIQIRGGLARIIRAQRGGIERDLSPHWRGVDRPHKALSAWKPVWITTALATLLLTFGFIGLSYALNTSTENVLGQLATLDRGIPPGIDRPEPTPAPPPPPPAVVEVRDQVQVVQLEKVKEFLEEEIAEKLVTVYQDANTITVRIVGTGMFGSGSDQLQKAFVKPLSRVAEALNDSSGPVIIVGHSDNVPIRSSRFPSNMHLSLARAESVMKNIAPLLKDPDRLSAEGRADKDPIASNDTREGRAKNRRIEVVLMREAPPAEEPAAQEDTQ